MVFWHWLILSGIFLIIEVLSFTAFFLFFAIASLIMAIITFSVPELNPWLQIVIASIFAILSCLLWYKTYKHYKKSKKNKDALAINVRLQHYIGKEMALLTDVENGYAKVKLGDTQWRLEVKENLKKGDIVIITGFDSTTLKAKAK